MKEIRNKTSRPVRVPLPGGRTLHLGPAQVAQIADRAVEHATVQELVTADLIEILGEGEKKSGSPGQGVTRERARGGTKTFRRGQGDR